MTREVALAIQVVGFGVGTTLFLSLLYFAAKAKSVLGSWQPITLMASAGLLWNGSAFVFNLQTTLGIDPMAPSSFPLLVVGQCALAFCPTASLLLVDPRVFRSRRFEIGSRILRWVSWTLAVSLTVALLASVSFPSCPFSFSAVAKATAYNLMLHVGMMVIILLGAEFPSRTRRHVGMFLWILGIVGSALIGVLIHVSINDSLRWTLTVVSQQLSIPWALGAFAFCSRFRYADVFVKWGITVVVLGATGLVLAILGAPLLEGNRPPEEAQNAFSIVKMAGIFIVSSAGFFLLTRELHSSIDRWLFRRPNYSEVLGAFSLRSEDEATEEVLLRDVATTVEKALGGHEVNVRFWAEGASDHDEEREQGSAFELDSASHEGSAPPSLEEAQREILWEKVLLRQGQPMATISVCAVPEGRKLLSEEIAFLENVSDRLGRRLNTLHRERVDREAGLRETRLREQLALAELRALRTQVHPHFLFNTLNTILDLIVHSPEKAEIVTERLASVFRLLLAKRNQDWTSVDEEFSFIAKILEIEQARFGERFTIEMHLPSPLGEEQIPTLLLQPLVENAIKHGIAPKLRGGTLTLRAEDRGDRIAFLIEDDGVGFRAGSPEPSRLEETPRRSSKVGLENVRDRLRTAYGAEGKLRIEKRPGGGSRVSVEVPKSTRRNHCEHPAVPDPKSESS